MTIDDAIADFAKNVIAALEELDLFYPRPSDTDLDHRGSLTDLEIATVGPSQKNRREDLACRYKNLGAVYVYYDQDEPLYVGQSSLVLRRLMRHDGYIGRGKSPQSLVKHRSTPHRNLHRQGKGVSWDFLQSLPVRILPIKSDFYRLCVEFILIAVYTPVANF